jgi:hypothetical protein
LKKQIESELPGNSRQEILEIRQDRRIRGLLSLLQVMQALPACCAVRWRFGLIGVFVPLVRRRIVISIDSACTRLMLRRGAAISAVGVQENAPVNAPSPCIRTLQRVWIQGEGGVTVFCGEHWRVRCGYDAANPNFHRAVQRPALSQSVIACKSRLLTEVVSFCPRLLACHGRNTCFINVRIVG